MNIIGVSGKKRSGKGTTSNIIHGIMLKELGLVKDFNLNGVGGLVVNTSNASGEEGWGEWDINRKDAAFSQYAELNMWPYVKTYSFADSLKAICRNLFNIPDENLYGDNEQKNAVIDHLRWENMPGVTSNPHMLSVGAVDMACSTFGVVHHKSGPMTAREFLQFFGTQVMRKMWEPIWCADTINRILSEQSQNAVIPDVRFPNEVEAILDAGGCVIRLNRDPFSDTHKSETALDKDNFDQSKFSYVIENGGKSTIDQLQQDIKRVFADIRSDKKAKKINKKKTAK